MCIQNTVKELPFEVVSGETLMIASKKNIFPDDLNSNRIVI